MKKNYPLIDVERIKKKRLEEAEKVLRRARETLATEEKQLVKDKKALDEIIAHKKETIEEYFSKFETEKMTGEKIETTLNYVKNIIEEKIKVARKTYEEQKNRVKKAQEALDAARHDHYLKNQDLEKIQLHYKEWLKGEHKIELLAEENLMDELGSNMYSSKKDQGK
jgi:hypothetical protein